MVIGTKGASFGPSGSWGSMARVVVEAAGDDATVVRVLSRRRMAKQVAAKEDYSSEILSQIGVRLGLPQM
jgi:ribulose 1,5-bisphosphate synthetase/thiazole synthase